MQQRIRRALVSVFDKDGVLDFCRRLVAKDVQIVSSGGTAKLLEDQGLPVTRVSDYTGFPEMLDGRVKTLHPRIHGGILARRDDPRHMKDLNREDILPIDLVVVNLYPFEKTAARAGIGLGDVVEMIDIGGPTLVRAAAKNYAHVGVIVDPGDYDLAAEQIEAAGGFDDSMRLGLAVKAFRHTASYDQAVCSYLARVGPDGVTVADDSEFPDLLRAEFVKSLDLRYGENPHQSAALYRDAGSGPSLCAATKLQGKSLSFNNMLDLDAALGLAAELDAAGCVIIKHGNPCGVGLGSEPGVAFARALECDPVSAFGGVIAFNRPVDARAAAAIAEGFFEAVIAPVFDDEARAALARKKKLRLLEVGRLDGFRRGGFDIRRISGGLLVQDWDRITESVRESRVVTTRQPTPEEWAGLGFAWTVCKHVKSNAIVYAVADRTLGIGAGQMSLVDSARIGSEKAQSPLEGCAMASDAFFPFRDGIDVAAKAGVRAIVQPGGSIRDGEVIEAAEEHGITMVFTERRHFRH